MRKWLGKSILSFALSVLLAGCSPGMTKNLNLEDTLPVRDIEVSDDGFTVKSVGVYLDVTPSMDGFLGMGTEEYEAVVPETRYEICMDEINKILARQYNREQVTYYRVDTPLWKTEENVLKEAREKEYYQNSKNNEEIYIIVDWIDEDGEDYDSLCLTNALLNCKEDDFSVLITDFHENKGTGDEVISALKKNVESGKTIGIVGIRSEFAGTVYDYDLDGRREEYGIIEGEVSAEDICYRQFYVIAVGRAEVVGKFCEDVRKSMRLDKENIKSILFYKDELHGMDYRAFNECLIRSNERKWRFIPNASIRINDGESLDVFDYCNRGGEKKELIVCYNVEEEALKTELANGEKCVTTISELQTMELVKVPFYMKEQALSHWNSEQADFEREENLAGSFNVEHVYYAPGEGVLYIVFDVSENELPQGYIKLSGEIHLKRQNTLDTGWVKDWDFAYGERNMGKTKNLEHYMNAIKDNMPKRNDLLLDFVFYMNYIK